MDSSKEWLMAAQALEIIKKTPSYEDFLRDNLRFIQEAVLQYWLEHGESPHVIVSPVEAEKIGEGPDRRYIYQPTVQIQIERPRNEKEANQPPLVGHWWN